jgi:hypothetical protein
MARRQKSKRSAGWPVRRTAVLSNIDFSLLIEMSPYSSPAGFRQQARLKTCTVEFAFPVYTEADKSMAHFRKRQGVFAAQLTPHRNPLAQDTGRVRHVASERGPAGLCEQRRPEQNEAQAAKRHSMDLYPPNFSIF